MYKLNSFFISLIFCLAIFIPPIIATINSNKDISVIEKRTLSKLPKTPTNINEINAYPRIFSVYYSDHFGFRDLLTKYYKLIKYSLGDSPSKDVTLGKNGWLFLGSIKKGYNNYDDPIGDVRNINLYTENELNKFSEYMTSLNSWLDRRGIKYIFVLAPNKHTIYFDQLPDYISKSNRLSATDQLVNHLKEYTNITVVDLRTALFRGKNKNQLYYKTGTHWNFMGANIAQFEILNAIKKFFPEKISPVLYDESYFEQKTVLDIGLESMAGIEIKPPSSELRPNFGSKFKSIDSYIKETKDIINKPYTIINNQQKLSAVIFRDSFFSILFPYFEQNFKRSTFIWEKLNYPSLVKYIKSEKPDVIIEQWVERNLPYTPLYTNEFDPPYIKTNN